MFAPAIQYLDPSHAAKLKRGIKVFYDNISKDQFYIDRKFWTQQDWEVYERHFKKHLHAVADEIASWMYEQHDDIRRTISKGEIYELLHGGGLRSGLIHELTFRSIPLLVLTKVEEADSKGTLTFEPRDITLKSVLADAAEMDSIIGLFDQGIADRVHFYKTHKTIAVIDVTNIVFNPDPTFDAEKRDPNFEWEFGGVTFVSGEGEVLPKHLRWARETASVSDVGIADGAHNYALIKFDGCSAYKAFAVAPDYFNYAFGLIRLLGSLRLNRQYWTDRSRLQIPQKSPAFISSADNTMWSAISTKIDNDFFVALQENSIYKPIVLSPSNVGAMESFEGFRAMKDLLERVRQEKARPIDEKVLDALSWFSESLKNSMPLHKVVGFITALETLLTDPNTTEGVSDKTISELFAERGAIMLHNSYDERVAAKKKLKRVYGLRSRVVHGSRRSLAETDRDESQVVWEIESIAAEVISKLIQLVDVENIQTIPELNSYVERKLLS